MSNFVFYDLRKKTSGAKLDSIFPAFDGANERIAFFSPHDDDVLLGAGYLMSACAEAGLKSHLYIFCDGSAGYSTPAEKNEIVERRKIETAAAYAEIGLDRRDITWFDFPDFSVSARIGWRLPGGVDGTFAATIPALRKFQATRLVIPNGYREHVDHNAVEKIGIYDAPQVGDAVVAEWGSAPEIASVFQYAVWGDFAPEAVGSGNIRADKAIKAAKKVEEKIIKALSLYKSQAAIIERLISQRRNRKIGDDFIELYREIDPRPQLDYAPYRELIGDIDKKAK